MGVPNGWMEERAQRASLVGDIVGGARGIAQTVPINTVSVKIPHSPAAE